MKWHVAAAAVLLLAGGCATGPRPQYTEDWPARREALQALAAWTLSGRVAIAAAEDGFSGGLLWRQRGDEAEISLHGPMGAEAIRIHVVGDTYSVDTANGQNYTGEDAERFLQEQLGPGQPLPISEMRYWLVGAPEPAKPHEETLGLDQRLASLSQSGWVVRYDRYESVGARALPARIEMTTQGLRLRVAVSDWQLPP